MYHAYIGIFKKYKISRDNLFLGASRIYLQFRSEWRTFTILPRVRFDMSSRYDTSQKIINWTSISSNANSGEGYDLRMRRQSFPQKISSLPIRIISRIKRLIINSSQLYRMFVVNADYETWCSQNCATSSRYQQRVIARIRGRVGWWTGMKLRVSFHVHLREPQNRTKNFQPWGQLDECKQWRRYYRWNYLKKWPNSRSKYPTEFARNVSPNFSGRYQWSHTIQSRFDSCLIGLNHRYFNSHN